MVRAKSTCQCQQLLQTSKRKTSPLEPENNSTPKRRMVSHPQPSSTSDTDTNDEGYDGLNLKEITLTKEELQRKRKARNQRRYYRRRKAEQQVKSREHTARSRALALEMLNPSSQDEDEDDEQSAHTFTLVPVNPEASSVGSGYLSSALQVQPFDNPSPFPVDRIRPNARVDGTGVFHEPQEHEMFLFLKHDVRGRMAFIRQTLASMEAEWGTISRWPVKFTRDWPYVKDRGKEVVHSWFGEIRGLLKSGWRAITYLSRVMDGTGPSSIDECRDIFLEAQRLSSDLHLGVLGLELRLDLVVEQYQFISLSL